MRKYVKERKKINTKKEDINNDSYEKEFYEFGAHFKYKDLYHRLEIIKANRAKKEYQKEILKTISNKKKIEFKIPSAIKKEVKREKSKPSTINVINNNNINLTNFNVNVNLNVSESTNSNKIILENLKQIEQKILKGIPINKILSRNVVVDCHHQAHQTDFSSANRKKNAFRNLTLYNAIKGVKNVKKKKEEIIHSQRSFSLINNQTETNTNRRPSINNKLTFKRFPTLHTINMMERNKSGLSSSCSNLKRIILTPQRTKYFLNK